MKKILSILTFTLFCINAFAQNTKVMDSPSGTVISNSGGTDIPYSSSILDIRSINKAVLLPRMTTTNRDAIASPIAGMLVYNSSTNQFNFHDGITWQQLYLGNQWNINGSDISYSAGNIGIGTNSPIAPINVFGATGSRLQFNTTGTGTTSTDGFSIGNSNTRGYIWNYENENLVLGTNNTERITILNNGNVGISSINPVAPLNIFHSSEARLQFNTNTSGITVNDGLYISQNNVNKGFVWNIENAGLAFGTNNTEKVSILNTGNVGIGNTNPSQKLSVNGNIAAPTLSLNSTDSAPNANAILDMVSTTKGIIIPRMTTAQRIAIPNTAGLMVYDTDYDGFWYNNGSIWRNVNSSWDVDAATTYTHTINNSTVVGIGMIPLPTQTSPATPGGSVTNGRLQIQGSQNADQLTLKHPNGPGIRWGFWVSQIDSSLNFFHNGNLRAKINRVTGVYSAVSDRNLKKNITVLNPVLQKIMGINAYQYNMIDDENSSHKSIGMMAQDLLPDFPELVTVNEDRETQKQFYMVNYSGIGVLAIKAIQEQQAIINDLQKQIDELKKMVIELKK